jgi:hypothetical protein
MAASGDTEISGRLASCEARLADQYQAPAVQCAGALIPRAGHPLLDQLHIACRDIATGTIQTPLLHLRSIAIGGRDRDRRRSSHASADAHAIDNVGYLGADRLSAIRS